MRIRETAAIQSLVDEVTLDTEEAVYDGLKAIRTVLEESPSLCTPTFVRNAQDTLRTSLAIRQVLVETRMACNIATCSVRTWPIPSCRQL